MMESPLEPDILAALGAHQFRARRLVHSTALPHQSLDDYVASAVETGTVRCRLSPSQIAGLSLGAADRRALEATWRQVADGYEYPFRGLRVGLDAYSSDAVRGLRHQIARATGVESVFLADTRLEAKGSWHWPLRLGFLPGAASRELRQEVERYHYPNLLEIVEIGIDASACDLLLVPALEALQLLGQETRIGSVLSVGAESLGVSLPELRIAGRRRGLSAIAQVSAPAASGDRVEFFRRFVDELSHNHPFDVALSKASGTASKHEMLAHPRFLESTRITHVLDQVADQIQVAARKGRLDDTDAARSLDRLEGLDSRLTDVDFLSERGGASLSARTAGALRPILDRIVPASAPRWLQVQCQEQVGDEWHRRRHSFRAGASHRIDVRIGPSGLDWLQGEEAFDERPLDDGAPFHLLEILLIARVITAGAKTAPLACLKEVMLPANEGPSTEARFDLMIPAEGQELQATLQVLYQNREIQSAVLIGPIEAGEDVDSGTSIRFQPSQPAAVDFELEGTCDLYLRRESDAVVVRRQGSAPTAFDPAGLAELDTRIRDFLFEAAYGAAQLDSGIDGGPGLDLLIKLAAQGRFLRDRLLDAGADLEQIRSVRVSSPNATNSVPAEIFYDGPGPVELAKLCPAFATGGGTTGSCPSCSATVENFVCPSLFWGLNRVIERQVISEPRSLSTAMRERRSPGPEPSKAKNALPKPTRIIMAASHQVRAEDRAATFREIREIDAGAKDTTSWKEWSRLGCDYKPTLLVALPHNVETIVGFEALEIGSGDHLRLDKIGEGTYFGFDQDGPGPIVLLLGCNTAAAKIAYQDFVHEVRRNGAAIVVGTLTTVLGRYAAPAATELVHLLAKRAPTSGSGESTPIMFGEALRRARWKMLQNGNPMALAIVSYGDPRWRLR